MWAKVDDGWWCHPKVMGLPLPARGLWVSALSWSCHQRRPIVPTAFLALVSASDDDATALVSAGLWNAVDGGWEIHQWADYQEMTLSEKRAEAGRKGGQASPSQANGKQTDKQTQVASQANGQAGTHPIPSHPDPDISLSSSVLPAGTDAELSTVSAVLDLIAEQRLQAQSNVRSPKAWLKRCRANLNDELASDVLEAVRTWDEPPHVLAAVVTGARDKRWLKRVAS